jgi:hypothetical protein
VDRSRTTLLLAPALWFGIPLLAVLLICLRFDFGAPVTDLFHEGEYLSSALSVAHADRYGFPVLVHGLLNYLPFEWASAVCGPDRSFACTRAINTFVVMFAMLAYLVCVWLLVRERRDLWLASVVSVVALFLMVNGRTPNLVYLHQGAPGIRDVLLFCELALLMIASGSARRAFVLAALAGAGMVAAVGLFWAYNRGLIGIGLLGTYMAVRLVARRELSGPLAAAAGLAAGMGALYLADPVAFAAHFSNILYWATHGDLWYLPGSLFGRAFFWGLGLGLVAWVALLLLRMRPPAPQLEMGAVLLVQMLAFLQVAQGRPDGVHFAFGLPAMLLLGLFALRLKAPSWVGTSGGAPLMLVTLVLLVLLDVNAPSPTLPPAARQTARNLRALATGMPRNAQLFGPRERLAAQVLAQAGPCTYALEGSGVLYALSGRPACSPFLYPAYVAPEDEMRLIAQLAQARPDALLVASRHWSMFVDDRTPAQRVPRLVQWIVRHYPHEYRVGDFVIRSDKQLSVPIAALRAANADTALFGPYDPPAPTLAP